MAFGALPYLAACLAKPTLWPSSVGPEASLKGYWQQHGADPPLLQYPGLRGASPGQTPPEAVEGLLPSNRSPAVLPLNIKGLILPLPPALGDMGFARQMQASTVLPLWPLCRAQTSSDFTREV